MPFQATEKTPEVAPADQAVASPIQPPGVAPPARLPGRTVALALLLVTAVAVLTPYIEFILYGTQIGSFAPSGNAVLVLLTLALLVNPLLRHLFRGRALPRWELICLYVVLLAVATLTSCQFAQWVVPVATGPFYYATPYNGWQEMLDLIPPWWAPADFQDIRRFYEGPKAGESVHWAVWWKPLLAWGSFIFVFYLTFLCITVLLRKAWIEQERLSFPLTQLPLELTSHESNASFFRNGWMWIGVLLPTFFHSLNGLHHLLPSVPSLPTRDFFQGDLYLTNHPWNAIGLFKLDIHFCLIGFAFLAGGDVALSMWVFYLLFKAELVLGAAFNWASGGEDRSLAGGSFPYIEAQHAGAMLAMVLLTLWTARAHLRAAVGKALGRRSDVDDQDEPLSYRMALWGMIIGFLLLTLWCMAAGMLLWAAALAMLLSLLFVIGMHRMMAEGGINFLWASQSSTNYLFFSLGSASFLPPKSWLVLVTLPYFVWNFKGQVGPQTLEGFKLLREARVHPRSVMALMVGSMALAMAVSYWAVIYFVHTHGGGVALDGYRFVHVGQRPFEELLAVQNTPSSLSPQKLFAVVLSALLTWVIGLLRWHFLGWRLHPVGYAASAMWAMHYMWFSIFLGSTARWLLTHFGGPGLYRQARPFFLGLILGDFLMLGIWLIVDSVLGTRGFFIFGA